MWRQPNKRFRGECAGFCSTTGLPQLGHCFVPGASMAPQLLQRSNLFESTPSLMLLSYKF